MSIKRVLYEELYKAYEKAHSSFSKAKIQCSVNGEWAKLKENAHKNEAELQCSVRKRISELNTKSTLAKSQAFVNFFSKSQEKNIANETQKTQHESDDFSVAQKTKDANELPSTSATLNAPSTSSVTFGAESVILDENDEVENENAKKRLKVDRSTPAQEKSKQLIETLRTDIENLENVIEKGFAAPEGRIQLKKLKNQLAIEKKALKRKESDAQRKKIARANNKEKLEKALEKHPDLKEVLNITNVKGRPRVETEQPGLLQAIIDISTSGSAADARRRTEIVRSCKTLDDLTENLKTYGEGFHISRSATYLRLIPKRSTSIEGKRHVNTVPVKLSRPEADRHAKHPDGYFCHATIKNLETLAAVLGAQSVIFLSQDDKAKVPLGITAVKKQAPILMHLEYRVTLPDHDWVVAAKHKLTPSVVAGICIKPDDEGRPESVTYSGPTFISIRSGKHCSSSAETHGADFDHLMKIPNFDIITKSSQGEVKPILIVIVDGGPDENPRYPRVIATAIGHFKKYNFDGVFIATNAPGRSAYNRVERRMAPLSNQLSGVILPHDHFGSHLDSRNQTIDEELEMKNFEHAGKVLAEVWNEMIIDGHPVCAEYVPPEMTPLTVSPPEIDEWYTTHVRDSQYFLQIVKCEDEKCCAPYRSSLRDILQDGFLPPPIPITKNESGRLHVPLPANNVKKFAPLLLQLSVKITTEQKDFPRLPYDFYCPTVSAELVKRTCKTCGSYFCSAKSLSAHVKNIHGKMKKIQKRKATKIEAKRKDEVLCLFRNTKRNTEDVEWENESDVEYSASSFDDRSDLPSFSEITSIDDWLRKPFVEDFH